MWWLLISAAFAADYRAPVDNLGVYTVPVDDLVGSPDGNYVGFTGGDGNFYVLDTRLWQVSGAVSSCGTATGAAAYTDGAGQTVFLTGCDDGLARITLDTTGATYTLETYTLTDLSAIYGVETDGVSAFVVGAPAETVTGSGGLALGVELSTGAALWTSTLNSGTVEDTALVGGALFVLYGGAVAAQVDTTSGTVSDVVTTSGLYAFDDAWPLGSAGALAADSTEGVIGWLELANTTAPQPLAFTDSALSAVAASTTEEFVVASSASELLFFEASLGSGAPGLSDEPDQRIAGGGFRELTVIDGYVLGVAGDGGLRVYTDRPWVTATSAAGTAVAGDVVSVSFTSDTAGDYELLLGGGAAGDGETLATGEIEADGSVSLDIEVDSRFVEGSNLVWARVSSGGAVGRGATTITVDNPPGAVEIGPNALSSGDSYLTLSFAGLEDADISHYIVYVDDSPFSRDDYPEGGPADFDKNDELELPMEISSTPGAWMSQQFYPLENGHLYSVAVRAVDAGGKIGALSNVRSAAPVESFSAAERAGETGGPPCGGAGGASVLGLFGACALRRRAAHGLAAVLLGLCLMPGVAEARDGKAPRTTSNVQLRYGPSYLADAYLLDGFPGSHQILNFEYGFASQFVDVNAGFGFWQEMGWLIDAGGAATDEHDMMTMLPITLTGTLRLDFLKEQPIVPIGRIGADYWLWKENWAIPAGSTEASKITGAKYGWHYALGGMLLLDALDRRAASELEASTGIDDTYFVVEWRKTSMNSESGFDLSSSELTFGVKCDF